MKKKLIAVAFAATMVLAGAMTAFASTEKTYTFDDASSLEGATLTGAKATLEATYTEPIIEDGKLVMDGTYGILLPETIDSDTYTVSFKVSYNAVTQHTATIFLGTWDPESWLSLGNGWQTTLIPGIWAKSQDTWYDVFSTTALETGKEYEFKYVVENCVATVYVDGVEVATGNVPSIIGGPIHIGVNAWDTPFNGTIDDLYIYVYNMTAEEEEAKASEEASIAESKSIAASQLLESIQANNASRKDDGTTSEKPADINPVVIVVIVVVVVAVIVGVLVASKKKKK